MAALWNIFALLSIIHLSIAAKKNSLRVMNMNAWGLSYFDDKPNTTTSYDVASIRASMLEYGEENFPNPTLLGALSSTTLFPDEALLGLLNPSQKKKIRLEELCRQINKKKGKKDIVFLQEVWLKKDYEMLKECTKKSFHVSPFDEECSRLNEFSLLECSGLMTLIAKKKKIKKKRLSFTFVTLPKATDFATATDPYIYLDNMITRKILIGDVKIKGKNFRLINTHLSPYNNVRTESEQLRLEQAKKVCQQIEGEDVKWDAVILGMDMNDHPSTSVYNEFIKCGFEDAFNPGESGPRPSTSSSETNTWTKEGSVPVTLDYVMGQARNGELEFKKFQVVDLKNEDEISISDHNAVLTTVHLTKHKRAERIVEPIMQNFRGQIRVHLGLKAVSQTGYNLQ